MELTSSGNRGEGAALVETDRNLGRGMPHNDLPRNPSHNLIASRALFGPTHDSRTFPWHRFLLPLVNTGEVGLSMHLTSRSSGTCRCGQGSENQVHPSRV